MIKHKHEREIIAWANGAKIEYRILEDKWSSIEAPNWIPVASYRVKPDCEYAFEVMKAHGILDLYIFWLNGEEVTAEHRSGMSGGKLTSWKSNLDPFHYFLDASECHNLNKKVVKVMKWLWIQVKDDKLVNHEYYSDDLPLIVLETMWDSGWIKTEHFIEVSK